MQARSPLPLVGVSCCLRSLKGSPFHVVGEKYITAVLDCAQALPLLIPALGERLPLDALIGRLDGLLLTGSPSNIEPAHYDGPPPPENNWIDPARDATTLPLIRHALAQGLPILGICRGMQELNVALGGSLFQEVHKVPGRFDHRDDPVAPEDRQYAPAHAVALAEGGLLKSLAEGGQIRVNSLHGQGIERLASGLAVEAEAPDGQIEAVRLSGAAFCVGVQWHPEYHAVDDALSTRLFAAFGAACRKFSENRMAIRGMA
jgi:putative glutamine amidotransferase